MPFRCFLPARVTAVFLPSAVIAYFGISTAAAAIGNGWNRLPATTWKVADDVGPGVKLMIGGLLLIGFLPLRRRRLTNRVNQLISGLCVGAVSLLLTIGIIPLQYSRGFGAALTGIRFDLATTSVYVVGGALAGIAFILSASRCQRTTLKG